MPWEGGRRLALAAKAVQEKARTSPARRRYDCRMSARKGEGGFEAMSQRYACFDGLFRFLREYEAVILAGVGFGLCRMSLNWATGIVQLYEVLPASGGGHLVTDAGKLVGMAAFVPLAYLRDRRRESVAVLVLPSCVLGAGVLMAYLFSAVWPSPGPLAAGCLLLGAGSAALALQWLELMGDMSPRSALLSVSWGYVANFALGAPLLGVSSPSALMAVLAVSPCSFVLLAACARMAGDRAAPRVPQPAGRALPPWPLAALLAVFAFAYGLGEGVTGMGHSTVVAKIGGIVPALLAIAGVVVLDRRFELRALYAVILPLMAAGIICTFASGSAPLLSQAMLSASIAACYILGYTLACMAAYQDGVSALLSCALVRALVLACSLGGRSCSGLAAGGAASLVVEVVVALMAVAFCAVLLRRDSYALLVEPVFERDGGRGEALSRLAEEAGLTKRETAVFQLMAQGKSAQEVAETLFISSGAARSHISRIYSKLGVHSHAEMEAEVARRCGMLLAERPHA